MARQLAACALVALCLGRADAWGWDSIGDAVSGAASSAGNSVSGAASSAGNAVSGAASSAGNAVRGAANQAGQSAADLANSAKDMTGDALRNVEHKACGLKAWEDVTSVNETMTRQLNMDCETQAARSPYMHDNIYQSCITMGLYNINRTLEKQLPKLSEECVQMLEDAPGDMAGTLQRWGEQSTKLLEETVMPAVQGAADKAKEDADGSAPAQKFNVAGPRLTRSGAAAYAPVPLLLALPFLASLAGLLAWRHGRRSASAVAEEELLASESDLELAV